MPIPSLQALILNNPNSHKGYTLALDPGETTGWVMMDTSLGVEPKIIRGGQLKTPDLHEGYVTLKGTIDCIEAATLRCVVEDYRIYSNKSDSHKLASLHTPKLIGLIYAICYEVGIPIYCRMAANAKAFCTDDKLRAWGMYIKGQRHQRDAIRHACYSLIFDKSKNKI